jgi:uncharacterized integral membrane protein
MSDQQTAPHRTEDRSGIVRWIIVALVVVVLVAVAFDNREEIYVVGDASAPVWVVLVAAGLAGILIGWLIKHRPSHHE